MSQRVHWCLATTRIAVFSLAVSTSPRVRDVEVKVQILSIKPLLQLGPMSFKKCFL